MHVFECMWATIVTPMTIVRKLFVGLSETKKFGDDSCFRVGKKPCIIEQQKENQNSVFSTFSPIFVWILVSV